jgi:hypothetical protein
LTETIIDEDSDSISPRPFLIHPFGCNVFGTEQTYSVLRTDTESSNIFVGVYGGKTELEQKVKGWDYDDVRS